MTLGAAVPPDRGRGGGPAIDRSVLGEWLAGDDAAIDELLAVFRDSIVADLGLLRELLAQNNLHEYGEAAHRMRGAALSMGARALADATGLLVAAARVHDAVGCRNGMPSVESHIQLVAAEIP